MPRPLLAALAVALASTMLAGVSTFEPAKARPDGAGSTASSAVVPVAAAKPPQLRRKGRWLVDQHGRVVIVHGVNLVWKRDPYVPPNTKAGFMARDAKWLARHGFNGARLGTLWAGLTPMKAGKADAGYLKKWQRVMDLLADEGIWMQLDMHQDQWHETYGGEGAPDWAMIRPAPFSALPPVNAPFPMGYWTPETSTVFDNFWANRNGLLDGWAAAWKVAARKWKNQPYLMGYDLLNEPWMGTEWAVCLATGCSSSYRKELQPAMEKATRAIRKIDGRNIVWWEPQQFAGGQPLETFFRRMKGERQLGLSWHNYCPDVFLESMGVPGGDTENCLSFARGRNKHALKQARRMNAVPLMSEWGATDNVRALTLDAQAADESLMGWLHWAYKRWNDPTTADTAQGLFRKDQNLKSTKKAKVRALVRTYAQATAGIPKMMRFNPKNGAFNYVYRPKRRIRQPTDIFVSPLHYPRGFKVRVTGGRVVERQGRHLLIVPKKGAAKVKVKIRQK